METPRRGRGARGLTEYFVARAFSALRNGRRGQESARREFLPPPGRSRPSVPILRRLARGGGGGRPGGRGGVEPGDGPPDRGGPPRGSDRARRSPVADVGGAAGRSRPEPVG